MSFVPKVCPHADCPSSVTKQGQFIKKGFFRIKRTNQRVRRFQCRTCLSTFSSRTFKPDYRHKKPDLNFKLAQLLVEGASLRSCSRLLGLTYFNTYLKFLWLRKIIDLKRGSLKWRAQRMQFDELETIHHTKCKPLSVALIVNERYELLGAQVAEMPAKGRLAEFSRRKYGPRLDQRPEKLKTLFSELSRNLQEPPVLMESDQKPGYLTLVQEFFPNTPYKQHCRAEKVRLQDRLHEKLQKRTFDPLFAINHKCALLRSHIKRLTRRSWCTTKKPQNLQLHLDLFIIMQFIPGSRF